MIALGSLSRLLPSPALPLAWRKGSAFPIVITSSFSYPYVSKQGSADLFFRSAVLPPVTRKSYRTTTKSFGAQRGEAYAALPKWRRKAHRPPYLDLVTLLRKQSVEYPQLTQHLALQPSHANLTQAAAA